MSYRSIDALTYDALFAGRVRACAVEQAETYRADARPPFVAVANACLRGEGETFLAFARITAAAPGVAAGAGDPVDQTRVGDEAILAAVQANWETVAGLYYTDDGSPLTRS